MYNSPFSKPSNQNPIYTSSSTVASGNSFYNPFGSQSNQNTYTTSYSQSSYAYSYQPTPSSQYSYQPQFQYTPTPQYQPTSYQPTSYQPTYQPSGYQQPTVNTSTYTTYQPTKDFKQPTQPTINYQPTIGITQPIQVQATLQKNTKDLSREEIQSLSKTGKQMFSNAFSKSATTSTVKDLMAQLKASGQKYNDLEFPPSLKSLTGGLSEVDLLASGNHLNWRSIIWLRADDIFGKGNYQVFSGKIEPDDIKQGSLGDCYFLSTLASMAEWPDRIKRLFEIDTVNEQGIYAVKVCDMGVWKTVIIDDYFPCSPDTRKPIFTRSNGNELWVMILEKVWAKIYGGYARIEAGLTRECLHDLTGAPTKYFLTGNPNTYEEIWKELLNGEKSHYIMTAGAGDFFEGADLLSSIGLVGSHAYSLLSVAEVKDKYGKNVRLVRLRNPWGQSEWTGDWSDNSSLWTPELRRQLGVENRDDGTFFMSFEDFVKYFSDMQICKAHDDYIYTHVTTSCDDQHATYFRMTVKKNGHYYLTVNQESKRKHLPSENCAYSEISIVVGRKEGQGYQYVEGFQRSDKEVWTDGTLTAGEYIVYVKIDWRDHKRREFTLSSYGSGEVTFEQVPKSYCADFIEKVYQSKGRVSKKLEDYSYYNVSKCYRAVELTDDGFGFIYYRNDSNKTLEEELYFKVLEGLAFRKPYRGNTIKVVVKPGEEKTVVTKVLPDAKKIRQAFTERVRFY